MSNITVKKEAVPAPSSTLEPFRMMRDLLSWDPFREMRALPYNLSVPEAAFAPAFEVKENKDSFLFRADVPGVKENDLEINITGDRLLVTGKRETEVTDQNDTWYTYERSYGSFSRAFTLPTGIDADHARAELKAGVLTLVLPKAPEAKGRTIEIKAGEKVKA